MKMFRHWSWVRSAAVAASALLQPFAVPAAFAEEPQSHYALVQKTLDQHILPRVAALSKAAAELPPAVQLVCKSGEAPARADLDQRFRATVEAYAAIDFLRFGPLIENGRREKLSFWPDPRGIVQRQLGQFILQADVAKIEPAVLAQQSAALQGLPALEALLRDKDNPLGPGDALAFRCRLGEAIAVNIAALARDLETAWTKPGGWKERMLRPGSDNETYKNPSEAASELVKALLTGFALVADVQLKPRVEKNTRLAGPYQKSDLSSAFYTAEVASLKAFYDAMGIEAYVSEDQYWIHNWATAAWRVVGSSDGLGGPAKGISKRDAPELRDLFGRITGLRKLVTREMSAAAGLTVGFNELDGD